MKHNVAFFIFLLPAHLYSMDKPSNEVIIPDRVDQYKFSPDGQRLLTLKSVSRNHLAKNYLVNLYATATGALLKSFPDRLSVRFKWSPKGTYFALKGLNLSEVLIMDRQGQLVRTIKTGSIVHKFNFSASEQCIYYDFIDALNRYQVRETHLTSGLTTAVSAVDFKNNVLAHSTKEAGIEFTYPEPIVVNKEWYTLTPPRFTTLDTKYSISYVEKNGDNDPDYQRLLIVPCDIDPKQAIQSAPMPVTPKLYKQFHYVHYTHDPLIIVLANHDSLLYAINIATKQVIPLNFNIKKTDLIKHYDSYKRKIRPFISKKGMYLQDSGNHTRICTLNWN